MSESTSNEGSATTDGNALPNRDPPDVMRFKSAAATRVRAHRWRRRLGLRCLTVRVNDRIVRHLISTGYLSDGSESTAYVAFALEAWINDNAPGAGQSRGRVTRLLTKCTASRAMPDASRQLRDVSPPSSPSRRTFLSIGRTVWRPASRPALLLQVLRLSATQSRARP
jgi:hypothetical protein